MLSHEPGVFQDPMTPIDTIPALIAQSDRPSALPGMLLSAGVLVVFLVVWRSLRGKLRRSFAEARVSSAEKIQRVRERSTASDGRDRLEAHMVDAEELTRRLAAMLDAKAERAERLLDLAEARIAELESRLGSGPMARRAGTMAPNPADAGAVPQPEIRTRSFEDIAARARSADAVRYERADPVAVDVYRLADEGKSALEIARALDEHTGKIELILALRD